MTVNNELEKHEEGCSAAQICRVRKEFAKRKD
jgi:hypothetical protein